MQADRVLPVSVTGKQNCHAFTLIELLVVIGLIAVLAGGIGLAFSGGDKSNALQGAQGTLQSLVSAARGQAALNGGNAALFVNVDTTPFNADKVLRTFVIAKYVQPTSGTAYWQVIGDEIALPAGTYLVPDGVSGLNGVTFENESAYKKTKDFKATPTTQLKYSAADNYPGNYAMVIEVNAQGKKTNSGAGGQLVLSSAEITGANSLIFKNPDLVRGALVSSYGVLTPINDESGFAD